MGASHAQEVSAMTTNRTAVLSEASDRRTESNREVAIDFLTRAARGEAHDAMQRYAAPDFIHHNPWFPPDAESLATAMDANARENPQKELRILRTVAEGPLVVVHSSVQHNPSQQAAAVVHVFRFEDTRIQELWDVGQEPPAESPNTAGMF
jgi:predicted SnoaL-like aldol condensation-catalyzing enzyme